MARRTLRLTSMIMWMLFGVYVFSAAYHGMGANHLMSELMTYIPGGRWGAIIFIQLVIFLLAMVLDPAGIMFIRRSPPGCPTSRPDSPGGVRRLTWARAMS